MGLMVSNFTKGNTPPGVFFTFSELYKWYQIAQSVTYEDSRISKFRILEAFQTI